VASDPKWRQVLEDLERRLGEGSISDRFPTDRELVEHYGVSRHTVREAVRHLRARGVIERERGRGSTVRIPEFAPPAGALYSLFREVESQGIEQRSEVLFQGWSTDDRASDAFGLEPDARLVRIERIRYAGDEPLAMDTVWLPEDLGAHVVEVDLTHASLYEELERRAGVRLTGGREIITAFVADDDLRQVLDLAPDEACLRIERTGELDGRLVECRTTLVRGSRFALISDWQATSAFTPQLQVEHRGAR
jgi:GntR family transcriptional regulator